MENTNRICPVCTLYLREGIDLQAHLETHPKEQVIQALMKISNGGTYVPHAQTASTSSASSQIPVQTITNSHSSFISSPYINPQTQMTTAVTYQHFMTSNGSAIMPQYIQVPTIVNPNVISNQGMNFMPSQSVNYSQTVYNPLYNPYIPQPYPFNPQFYANLPLTAPPSETAVEPNPQNENVNESEEVTIQEESSPEPSSVKKSAAITGKQTRRRLVKTRLKKLNLKCKKTRKKRRVFKSNSSEISSSLSVIKSPIRNDARGNEGIIALKRSVIRTLRPKSALGIPNLSVIPPAPLKLIIKPRTNSLLDPKTPPPPPPLSKAPCFVPLTFIKSEDVKDCVRPRSTPAIITSSDNCNDFKFYDESEKVNSVIVESNTLLPSSSSSDFDNCLETFEGNENDSWNATSVSGERKDTDTISTALNEEITITKVATEMEDYREGPEGEDEEEGNRTLEHCEDNMEKHGEYFEMIEVVEESKINLGEAALKAESKNIERTMETIVGSKGVNSCNTSSNMFTQSEKFVCNGNAEKEVTFPSVDVKTISVQKEVIEKESDSQVTLGFVSNEFSQSLKTNNIDIKVSSPVKRPEVQTITYTDLQTSKVLCDVSLPSSASMGGYVEVDGIKIFFKNKATTVPLDPIMKLSNVQSNSKDLTEFMKKENTANNSAVMDSVIQLVSGSSNESRNGFTFGENFTATTSQGSDTQLDLPDLSPLPLNIQADESMPARGELSEQESLGAENSTWNLFHGGNGKDNRSLDDWKNSVSQLVSVIGTKKGGKTFKCSVCNEVFSCPKERRVHKNTVHLNKVEEKSPGKKPKQYPCSFCSGVFVALRDRRIHVLEMHLEEHKNKKPDGKIKQERTDTESMAAVKADATIKNEGDQGGNKVKTENSIPSSESTEAQRVKYCSQCSLPFVGIKKLREHLRVVHGEIRFKCDTCSQTFDEDAEYNEHLLVHPLVCEKCGKTFHKRPNLNLHMKRHLEVKPYECTLCPKSFITRQKLEEHMNGHSGKKPLKCGLCDKTFSRHSNLIQHRNLHHFNVKKKIKDFVCRCGEVFHSFRKLEWHKEVHEPKPKPCPFCAQKFIHSASVTRHIRRAHLPDYLPGDNREYDNVQCPVCEKVYLRSSLVVHMRVHNGEKPFACKVCSKRFSTKWNLELHNWTHQSRSNMPFKCHICKGAFFREPDFVAHMNAHRNYKPFTCNICGQKFVRKYSCLRHQEEHKKTKQFVCAVSGCAKSFHRGYYLRDHMKVHTGIRPHTCHICGKASSTKSNHNKHVRIHDTREPVNTEN